ncbi:MAG: orotate phosphoribosyltransferase [Deltaproteobacteria bacterium]|nr:orotate phosphoribosyltransferase [Deltaproteobacteria bacterium]MCW5805555.1 orotate phosphoribosyltransferase [Deltaproteobacteria bacterium]
MNHLLDRPGFGARRERLLELLRTRAFQEREVVLSSGAKSNFYIDCKQVSLDAEGAALIGELFHDVIEDVAPRAVAAGGLTLGADPLATATSIASFQRGRPRSAFIVRKEPKGHGTNQWVEHAGLPAGAEVVILEDVVTTGAATLKAIERARLAGLVVAHAVALVDRLEGGRDAVVAEVPLTALFTRDDFMPPERAR